MQQDHTIRGVPGSRYFRKILPFWALCGVEPALGQSQPGYWQARLDGRG